MNKVIEQNNHGQRGGPDDDQQWMCEIQLPWSEDEFFNQAIKIPHPSEAEPIIPDRTKKAIIEILTCSPEEWILKQKTKLHRINELAKHLRPKEEHAKQQIDSAV